MDKLRFFSDYLKKRFGRALQRLPVDLALGCPNREARYGPGCIFCAENGSRARHLARHLDLPAQIAAGIEYNRRRYQAGPPYIAYFQSFTSTFAPVERLRALYEAVFKAADFRVVIVGTRPDALPPEVIRYLRELKDRYEVWVELGVQTACDATLARLRRGHDFAAVRRAAAELDAAGIPAAAHVILGLPGETADDWQHTAAELGRLPFGAVKLHQLQILKGTELAALYRASPEAVRPLNEYEYAEAAAAFLRALPADWLIMRLMADAEERELIAPRWWMSKGEFLTFFRRQFEAGETAEPFAGVVTADGSPTLYHPEFRQHFHSLAGAAGEAEHKFLRPGKLAERLAAAPEVRILDLGFGLGGNAFAAARLAAEERRGRVRITSLELDARAPEAARSLYCPDSPAASMLAALLAEGRCRTSFAELELIFGDARQTAAALTGLFDLIFLDGFSPDCNPELWSFDFLRLLRPRLADGGLLLSYSSSPAFRGALLKAGFLLGESAPFGRRRGGTVAALRPELLELPLPAKERNIIRYSTAGTPYFDRGLRRTREEILAHRRRLVEKLRRRGVPKWYSGKQTPKA